MSELVKQLMSQIKITYEMNPSLATLSALEDSEFLDLKKERIYNLLDKAQIGDRINVPRITKDGEFFLRKQFEKIEELETGKKLLESIVADKTPFRINFLNGRHPDKDVTGFYFDGKGYAIDLNLWNGSAIATTSSSKEPGSFEVFSISPLIKSKGFLQTGKSERDVVEVGKGLSPFYLTLAHEMTHMFHRGNGTNPNDTRLRSNTIMKDFPKSRNKEIWFNREEHRTVFNAADISEMKMRLEAGEPLRYLYQPEGAIFYEPVKTVLNNVLKSEFLDEKNRSKEIETYSPKSLLTLYKLQKTLNELSATEKGIPEIISSMKPEDKNKLLEYTKYKLLPHETGVLEISAAYKKSALESIEGKLRAKGIPAKDIPWKDIAVDSKDDAVALNARFDAMVKYLEGIEEKKVATAATGQAVIPVILAKAIYNGHFSGLADLMMHPDSLKKAIWNREAGKDWRDLAGFLNSSDSDLSPEKTFQTLQEKLFSPMCVKFNEIRQEKFRPASSSGSSSSSSSTSSSSSSSSDDSAKEEGEHAKQFFAPRASSPASSYTQSNSSSSSSSSSSPPVSLNNRSHNAATSPILARRTSNSTSSSANSSFIDNFFKNNTLINRSNPNERLGSGLDTMLTSQQIEIARLSPTYARWLGAPYREWKEREARAKAANGKRSPYGGL